jgi:hypothetical protein
MLIPLAKMMGSRGHLITVTYSRFLDLGRQVPGDYVLVKLQITCFASFCLSLDQLIGRGAPIEVFLVFAQDHLEV